MCSLEIDYAVILPPFENCSTKANSVTAVDIELDATRRIELNPTTATSNDACGAFMVHEA
jgi:hypothetical protein